jgi:hypothetical protein
LENIIIEPDFNFEIKNYFIAYFDILGFENMVSQDNKKKDLILLTMINDCISNSKEVITLFNKTGNKTDIKFKVFSDNFVFCTEKDYTSLLSMIAILQSTFLPYNIFIRGTLSYGKIYFNEEFIYGKGLIEAYKIESEIAIYPRIIIDDTFISGASKILTSKWKKKVSLELTLKSLNKNYCVDFDNNLFIDYLGVLKYLEDETGQPCNGYSFFEMLDIHARNICYNLQNSDKRIIQKYQWCKNYHNYTCTKYNIPDKFIN